MFFEQCSHKDTNNNIQFVVFDLEHKKMMNQVPCLCSLG